MFAAGFLFGSLTQRRADAQLKELGEAAPPLRFSQKVLTPIQE
jgi:hypothetical protein